MAKDKIHDAVKNALTNDNWLIIQEHLYIEYEELSILADIIAERAPFIAVKDDKKILVEIKTFGGASFMRQLQQTLGQYSIYRDMVEFTDLAYDLFLAISDDIYEQFFLGKAIQRIIQRHQIQIIVVNLEREEIVEWIQ
ncbi:MAG TPA: element excision factor XisH family protein [Caldilineaceae bacterium]|nr:element excision factor XisH family protein [Caldilineaceae bacterium]